MSMRCETGECNDKKLCFFNSLRTGVRTGSRTISARRPLESVAKHTWGDSHAMVDRTRQTRIYSRVAKKFVYHAGTIHGNGLTVMHKLAAIDLTRRESQI